MKNPFIFIGGGIIAAGVAAGGIYLANTKAAAGNVDQPAPAASQTAEPIDPAVPAPETGLHPQKPVVPDAAPEAVKAAVLNAPEDAFVGVGSAKMPTINQSRTIAASRAKADIVRQLNTAVEETVRNRVESGVLDSAEAVQFQERVTVKISGANLSGIAVIAEDVDESGAVWAAVRVYKADVTEIIESDTGGVMPTD